MKTTCISSTTQGSSRRTLPAVAIRTAAALAVLLVAASTVLAVAESTPAAAEVAIERLADQVLGVLRDAEADEAAKRASLETILVEHADFETMAKLVLARNYRSFSEDQRQQFVTVFKTYLAATYGSNINNYADETVKVTGSREEARGDRTVHTRILRSNAQDIAVDYRLRPSDENWRVIDVVAEGVSMVSNLRAQFQEVLSRGGPEKLLQVLRDKSAAATPDNAEDNAEDNPQTQTS